MLAALCGTVLLGACASAPPATSSSQKKPTLASASNASSGCLSREREYTLQFQGFAAKEIAKIEDYLVIFRCYGEHRPIEQRLTHVRYAYYSRINAAKLATNLNRMLGELEDAGGFASTLSMNGSTFAATKIQPRR